MLAHLDDMSREVVESLALMRKGEAMRNRVMSAIALGFFVCLLAPSLHAGQSRSPAVRSAAPAPSVTDEQFLKAAEAGGLAEIQIGKLAERQGLNDKVRALGVRMVTDHGGRAYQELWMLADSKKIVLESLLDAKAQATLDQLNGTWGLAFDRAYAAVVINDHRAAVAAFRKQALTSKDAEVKAWAQKMLPVAEEHLRLAQEVQKLVGSEVTPTAVSTR